MDQYNLSVIAFLPYSYAKAWERDFKVFKDLTPFYWINQVARVLFSARVISQL